MTTILLYVTPRFRYNSVVVFTVKLEENRIENQTFARYVQAPENRAALLAVQDVAACLCSGKTLRTTNPLYLHGPSGTGKTHLVGALVDEATRQSPQLIVTVLPAKEL